MFNSDYRQWQLKRGARQLQKLTNSKYTVARRYVEELHPESGTSHYHQFAIKGEPFEVEDETIFQLFCPICGQSNFAFATKTRSIVED